MGGCLMSSTRLDAFGSYPFAIDPSDFQTAEELRNACEIEGCEEHWLHEVDDLRLCPSHYRVHRRDDDGHFW